MKVLKKIWGVIAGILSVIASIFLFKHFKKDDDIIIVEENFKIESSKNKLDVSKEDLKSSIDKGKDILEKIKSKRS